MSFRCWIDFTYEYYIYLSSFLNARVLSQSAVFGGWGLVPFSLSTLVIGSDVGSLSACAKFLDCEGLESELLVRGEG